MKCVLCNKTRFKTVYTLKEYKILRCINCGLVKTYGRQTANYSEYHRDQDYKEYEVYFKNIFKKRFNLIKKYKNRGIVLDIGASTGNLLQIFIDDGWEGWGVEPSKAGSLAGKKIKIIKSIFEKAKLPKNYFDVVVMNHTLEHVVNPLLTLKKINSHLKPEGIVYIDVPNFASLSSQLAGKNWQFLLPNEHVHQFEPDSLKKLFKKADFEVVWQGTWSGIFDVANPLFKFWFTLTRGKKQFFTDLVEIPGNVTATALHLGTSLAMIGKKK